MEQSIREEQMESTRAPVTPPATPIQTRNNEEFTEIISALMRMNQPTQKTFKSPKFSGEGDVALFLVQFQDVARANTWGEDDQLLHLRSCLQSGATTYGSGDTVIEIRETLRARYGITEEKACDRLDKLKRNSKQPLHEYAAEARKLARVAYPDLDPTFADKQSLRCFK